MGGETEPTALKDKGDERPFWPFYSFLGLPPWEATGRFCLVLPLATAGLLFNFFFSFLFFFFFSSVLLLLVVLCSLVLLLLLPLLLLLLLLVLL